MSSKKCVITNVSISVAIAVLQLFYGKPANAVSNVELKKCSVRFM